jgi:aspartyl protease family protein
MPQTEGPWGRKPRPAMAHEQRRLLVWLALIVVGGLALWKLATVFPDAIRSDFDQATLIQLIGFFVLVSAGVVFSRRFKTKDALRNVALWCGVFAALVLIYTFRDELASVGTRIRSELIPGYPIATGAHEMTIVASDDGGFYVEGEINAAPARFLIDTGATFIVLSPADAARAGIDTANLDYSLPFESAHGSGFGASATVTRLIVGGFELHDVAVMVDKSPMSSSLLGMAFLHQLDSFEVHGKRLVLRWRS